MSYTIRFTGPIGANGIDMLMEKILVEFSTRFGMNSARINRQDGGFPCCAAWAGVR